MNVVQEHETEDWRSPLKPANIVEEKKRVLNYNHVGCSIGVIAGFPYDNSGYDQVSVEGLKKLELSGNPNNRAWIIAVSDKQKKAMEKIKEAGYVLLGRSKGGHPDVGEISANEMFLFGKGFEK